MVSNGGVGRVKDTLISELPPVWRPETQGPHVGTPWLSLSLALTSCDNDEGLSNDQCTGLSLKRACWGRRPSRSGSAGPPGFCTP